MSNQLKLLALAGLVLCLASAFELKAQDPLCTVSDTIRLADGVTPSVNAAITVSNVVVAGGEIYNPAPKTYRTNGAGVVTFTVPRTATCKVQAPVPCLDVAGGVTVEIPDSAAIELKVLSDQACLGTSFTSSVVAGGDLSGNYPNPSVVDDSHAHTGATLTGSAEGYTSGAWDGDPTVPQKNDVRDEMETKLSTTQAAAIYQPLDGDLTDLADGVLTGTKVDYAGAANQAIPFNKLGALTGNAQVMLGNFNIDMVSQGVGGFSYIFQGAGGGHLFTIEHNSGNMPPGTHLIHASESSNDDDVLPAHFTHNSNGTDVEIIRIEGMSPTPANDDEIAIVGRMNNQTETLVEVAKVNLGIADISTGLEDGSFAVDLRTNGVMTRAFVLSSSTGYDTQTAGNTFTDVEEFDLSPRKWTRQSATGDSGFVGTNSRKWAVLLDATTDEVWTMSFVLPSYTSAGTTFQLEIKWYSAAATAGSAVFGLAESSVGTSGNFDPVLSAITYQQTTTDGVAGDLNVTTIALASPGWSAGEVVALYFRRDADGTGGTDNLAGDAVWIGAKGRIGVTK